uniref:Uncharacterized protein n=1 Tax=Nelumbo nucifera TaxID=4432 RepID=A0A822XKS4_NELNU|nr:TPA_asm: hypothetical protein HUJ06_021786 [Nelumbo nucifera]
MGLEKGSNIELGRQLVRMEKRVGTNYRDLPGKFLNACFSL